MTAKNENPLYLEPIDSQWAPETVLLELKEMNAKIGQSFYFEHMDVNIQPFYFSDGVYGLYFLLKQSSQAFFDVMARDEELEYTVANTPPTAYLRKTRPGTKKVHMADASLAELLEKLRGETSHMKLLPLNPNEFVSSFLDTFQKDTDWIEQIIAEKHEANIKPADVSSLPDDVLSDLNTLNFQIGEGFYVVPLEITLMTFYHENGVHGLCYLQKNSDITWFEFIAKTEDLSIIHSNFPPGSETDEPANVRRSNNKMASFSELFEMICAETAEMTLIPVVRDQFFADLKRNYELEMLLTEDDSDIPMDYSVFEKEMAAKSKPSFFIETGSSNPGLFDSRLGGLPVVDASFEWPYSNGNPMSFIAQIHLDTLPPSALPKKGFLSFFYDVEEMGFPEDRGGWKVIYSPDVQQLKVATQIPDDLFSFETCAISFKEEDSFPPPEFISSAHRRAYADFYEERLESLPMTGVSRLLGHPDQIQNEMITDCQRAFQNVSEPNEKEEETWLLLFQCGSEDAVDMMWGDCGMLYFWIREKDLENQCFDHVWLILQCS